MTQLLNAVTDPVLLRELTRQRINASDVVFSQDYAHRGLGKGHSPYAKFYRGPNGANFMVVAGLPMVTADNDPIVPGWRVAGTNYFAEKTNLMAGRIQGRDVELTVRNDDAVGRKKGARLSYSPQLFVGGVEIQSGAPVLVPVDPWNPNYTRNVLEWDYGVCKRKLRQVEGRVHGYWVFPANPGGDVLIRYNQAGDYRLKLGEYRQNDDEEFIPATVFAQAIYPFEVSDSATYYPDAHVESTSVDGQVGQLGTYISWAALVSAAGTSATDSGTNGRAAYFYSSPSSSLWTYMFRSIYVFDTSGLPDAAVISAATLSLYGQGKLDEGNRAPDLNIYSSAPASNTALVAGDFDSIGPLGAEVAFSTAITYAGFSTAGYNDFALNANGIATISKTVVSKFGARNANYDVANSSPSWITSKESYFNVYFSEKGNGFKPKLVVTYTVPAQGGFLAFM